MKLRPATLEDCALLAELNHQLIRDEGHRNPMTVAELEQRMRGWLSGGEYRAILFERDGSPLVKSFQPPLTASLAQSGSSSSSMPRRSSLTSAFSISSASWHCCPETTRRREAVLRRVSADPA